MSDEDAQTTAAIELLQNALEELGDAYAETLCLHKQQIKIEADYDEQVKKENISELTLTIQRQEFRRSRLRIDALLSKILRHKRIFTRKLNQLTT